MRLAAGVALFLAFATIAEGADRVCVVAGQSHFYIHTGTAGLFGAFAHEHLIEAQNIDGCASIDAANPAQSSIRLTFNAAEIRVLDPKESPADRAKVQSTMETQVLRSADYPAITFESTAIQSGRAPEEFRVRGNLTIRGRTEPVIVPLTLVRLQDGSYRAKGEYAFKQTLFGIQPVRLAAGAIKVKDEIRTEFELLLK